MPISETNNMTFDALAIRIGCAGFAAGTTGAISAWVRPMISGPVHYEALLSMFVVLPIILIALVWSFRHTPWKRVSGRLLLAVLCACLAFAVGWSIIYGKMWDDMVFVMAAYAFVACLVCWLMLVGMQRFFHPIKGPHCPTCWYCLIGVSEDRCPECGAPFTLADLGITRDALKPQNMSERNSMGKDTGTTAAHNQ